MPGTKSSDKAVAMILPGRQYACGNVEKCMSYGVVPSRHIGLASAIRGLRPRLPSLCSVVPSRHLILMAMKFAQRPVFGLLYGTLCYGAGKGACPVA